MRIYLARRPIKQPMKRPIPSETTEAYRAYMQSSEWEAKKRAYFKTHARACKACGSTRRLHLHHVSYRLLGREPLSDLVCLCHPCHDRVHAIRDQFGGDLRTTTHKFITESLDAAAKAATGRRPRRRRSLRLIRFRRQLFPACRANRDTCDKHAPTRSGYCWDHDPAISGTLKDSRKPALSDSK